MVTSFESKVFTNDHSVAEATADFFTRNSLSPIHLEDAIEDYMSSLKPYITETPGYDLESGREFPFLFRPVS